MIVLDETVTIYRGVTRENLDKHKKNDDDTEGLPNLRIENDYDWYSQVFHDCLIIFGILAMVFAMIVAALFMSWLSILVEMIENPITAILNAIVGSNQAIASASQCNIASIDTCAGGQLDQLLRPVAVNV